MRILARGILSGPIFTLDLARAKLRRAGKSNMCMSSPIASLYYNRAISRRKHVATIFGAAQHNLCEEVETHIQPNWPTPNSDKAARRMAACAIALKTLIGIDDAPELDRRTGSNQ